MKKQIDPELADRLKQAFPNASQDELEEMALKSGDFIEGILACYLPDPLLEMNQRRVLELTDEIKLFTGATVANTAKRNQLQREIDLIESAATYRNPALMPVLNRASHPIDIRGKTVEPRGAAEVYPWEYRALARFLEFRF